MVTPSAEGKAQDSVRQPKTGVPPTVLRNQCVDITCVLCNVCRVSFAIQAGCNDNVIDAVKSAVITADGSIFSAGSDRGAAD